jgi:hypothetical protein
MSKKTFEVTVQHSYYTTYLVEADSAQEAMTEWEFGEVVRDELCDGPPSEVVEVIEEDES